MPERLVGNRIHKQGGGGIHCNPGSGNHPQRQPLDEAMKLIRLCSRFFLAFAGRLYSSSRADNKQNLEVRYQTTVKFVCHYPNES